MNQMRLPIPNSDPIVRIAASRRDLVGAFELVYSAYLAKGYVRPHPERMVYQPVFGLPSSRTMVAAVPGNSIAGTLSIVGDNRFGFQLETTYRDEVQLLRNEGRKLAEITCLTIESAGGFLTMEIFVALTRFTIHYALWRGYDDLLMAVHPRHYRFYWRILRATPLGPARAHEVVQRAPSLCCRIDLGNLKRNMTPELSRRYYSCVYPERQFLRPPISPADHQYCCNRTGVSSDLGSNVFSAPDRDGRLRRPPTPSLPHAQKRNRSSRRRKLDGGTTGDAARRPDRDPATRQWHGGQMGSPAVYSEEDIVVVVGRSPDRPTR